MECRFRPYLLLPGRRDFAHRNRLALFQEFDVQPQALEFPDQHVERFRHIDPADGLALDDGFVGLAPAGHVIGFDGQYLLKGVSRAIGFERPDFHFPEALAAELGLAPQGLLGDERVRANGSLVDLVLHHVVELQYVLVTHGDLLVEGSAALAIVEGELAVLGESGPDQLSADLLLGHGGENRGDHFVAQGVGRQAQMGFQNLPQVHAGNHPQRREDDVYRRAIREERHVFDRNDLGNDSLVAVPAVHLVAHLDLALIGHGHLNGFGHAGGEFVADLPRENLDVDHLAVLAMLEVERGIADIPGFLAEDGPEQFLLGRKLSLALGGNLTHQDIAGTDLGADADHPLDVQIFQLLFRNVGNVGGDRFGPELGVADVNGIIFYVDGSEAVVVDHPLRNDDGVLVVVALPGEEGDEHVLPQGQLAALKRRAVEQEVAFFDFFSLVHRRALVEAGRSVGKQILVQIVSVNRARGAGDLHPVALYRGDRAVFRSALDITRVAGSRPFGPGADTGGFGADGGHAPALHVGAHQSPDSIVVLEKGNQSGGDGNDLLGRNVHVVDLLDQGLGRFAVPADGRFFFQKVSIQVDGGCGRGRDGLLLMEGMEPDDFAGDPRPAFLIFDYPAIGGLDEP